QQDRRRPRYEVDVPAEPNGVHELPEVQTPFGEHMPGEVVEALLPRNGAELSSETRRSFEHSDGEPRLEQLQGGRHAGHASADDSYVRCVETPVSLDGLSLPRGPLRRAHDGRGIFPQVAMTFPDVEHRGPFGGG